MILALCYMSTLHGEIDGWLWECIVELGHAQARRAVGHLR
jgi:hypothetical protein